MNKQQPIKLFVMDVDGTLTDGKVYIGSNGELMKAFSIKDGYGIRNLLIPAGIIPVIITGRKSDILEYRCSELGITDIYQNVDDKFVVLKKVCHEYGISLSEVAYIGDDMNDMSCMIKLIEHQGVVGCPADATKAVKSVATYISEKNGGDGAVRDFIDYILGDQI